MFVLYENIYVSQGPYFDYGVTDEYRSNIIKSLYFASSNFKIPTPQEIFDNDVKNNPWHKNNKFKYFLEGYPKAPILKNSNEEVISISDNKADLKNDIYTLVYEFGANYNHLNTNEDEYDRLTYVFAVTENRLDIKKWTITDVIVRCCDLIEPLRYGEKPRFRFDGVEYDETTGRATGKYTGQALEYNKIIAPEFSFTKMTFREQMQQVGGKIHAEFRIKERVVEDNDIYYSFYFQKYGEEEISPISEREKVTEQVITDINNYATSFDSSVDNLINQVSWAQGVNIEPYNKGYISLRTDIVTARIEDNEESFIPTSLPIYQVKKVFCVGNDGEFDITPYIFEKTDYINLSSYENAYPFSKNYALYYTQGEKNIKGLFFKREKAWAQANEPYAIVNILRTVTGDNTLIITEYPKLSFRIEYLPIYSQRTRTNKRYIIGGIPRTMVYNQNANMIESSFYNDNLKGAIERLGNPEKQITYLLAFIKQIPKVGQKYDERYYISSVSCEYLPTHIKCTIGLSKNFNRLSSYIGINSEKRMWEISEKSAFERNNVYTEYILLTSDENKSKTYYFNTIVYSHLQLPKVFLPKANNINDDYLLSNHITGIGVRLFNKKGTPISNKFYLPVISTATAYGVAFQYEAKDNYSVGQSVVEKESIDGNKITGFFGNYTSYGDYYGRAYWLTFNLFNGREGTPEDALSLPLLKKEIGSGPISTHEGYPYSILLRKDSREKIKQTIALEFVTDDEDLIIGNGLTTNNFYVKDKPLAIKLYTFTGKLNILDSRVDLSNATEKSDSDWWFSSNNMNGCVTINHGNGSNIKAWALCLPKKEQTIDVEDENGKPDKQTIDIGSLLVLGSNNISGSSTTIYFTPQRKVYE